MENGWPLKAGQFRTWIANAARKYEEAAFSLLATIVRQSN